MRSAADKKSQFKKFYPEYGTIGATLKAIGIKARNTFRYWCEVDPEFKRVYQEELLPNRRDEVASVIYQAATGRIKLNKDQLTAAFGFAKATDHAGDPYDNLVFTEKHQMELANKDDKPLILRVEIGNATAGTPFREIAKATH